MEGEGYTLKTDPEFRRLVFPCGKEEYNALEQQILQDGCRQPVVTWYGYIVQGFEQYEVCKAYGIAFKSKKMNFRVREEVISLICREELNTRDLPENQRRYLIGKRYNADIVIGAHNAAGTDRFKERSGRELSKGKNLYESNAGLTREKLAGEYHLNQCSIIRYSFYARAIDYIASMKPEAAPRILSGEMRTSIEAVVACQGKTEEEITRLLAAPRGSRNAKEPAFTKREAAAGTTVKDMPAFDPDAEINSLALTIPSWISSIDRTRSAAKFPLLTSKGRSRLEQELCQLQTAAQSMLFALKEVN